jgi:hypothetical protein
VKEDNQDQRTPRGEAGNGEVQAVDEAQLESVGLKELSTEYLDPAVNSAIASIQIWVTIDGSVRGRADWKISRVQVKRAIYLLGALLTALGAGRLLGG